MTDVRVQTYSTLKPTPPCEGFFKRSDGEDTVYELWLERSGELYLDGFASEGFLRDMPTGVEGFLKHWKMQVETRLGREIPG